MSVKLCLFKDVKHVTVGTLRAPNCRNNIIVVNGSYTMSFSLFCHYYVRSIYCFDLCSLFYVTCERNRFLLRGLARKAHFRNITVSCFAHFAVNHLLYRWMKKTTFVNFRSFYSKGISICITATLHNRVTTFGYMHDSSPLQFSSYTNNYCFFLSKRCQSVSFEHDSCFHLLKQYDCQIAPTKPKARTKFVLFSGQFGLKESLCNQALSNFPAFPSPFASFTR